MKQKLIELAKKKGFESINLICLQSDNNFAGLDDELTYYLWLCELKKWLRDNYKLIIQIDFYLYNDDKQEYPIYEIIIFNPFIPYQWGNGAQIEHKEFKSYEVALENGCFVALKLIP